MTLNEKIEANADLVLWCVHIRGQDDVLAAPCHEAAVVRARTINQQTHSYSQKKGLPTDILCFAYAAPWPHAPDYHAEDLKNWPAVASQDEVTE